MGWDDSVPSHPMSPMGCSFFELIPSYGMGLKSFHSYPIPLDKTNFRGCPIPSQPIGSAYFSFFSIKSNFNTDALLNDPSGISEKYIFI